MCITFYNDANHIGSCYSRAILYQGSKNLLFPAFEYAHTYIIIHQGREAENCILKE